MIIDMASTGYTLDPLRKVSSSLESMSSTLSIDFADSR